MQTHPVNLLHIFPTFDVGGSQMRLTRIINASSNESIQHNVVSLDGNWGALDTLSDSHLIRPVDCPDLKQYSLPKRIREISKMLRSMPAVTLMTYNWGAIEWALVGGCLMNLTSVHWEDGFGPEEQSQRYWRRNVLRRIALMRHNQVIVPSRQLERIAESDWGLPSSRLCYFPNGIVIPENPNRGRSDNTDRIVLGTVATLRQEKDIAFLIETTAALPDRVVVKIAGGGPEFESLSRLVKRKNLEHKVELVGHISDVYGFLADIDIFCLTSNTEQMPISILEAMAASMPIVSTDVGDIAQMVASENLSYVVPKSELCSTLLTLIDRPHEWATIGNANFEKASRCYSFDSMVERFVELTRDFRASK